METLKIAIAGIGTVGSGLLNIIIENKLFIESKIEKKIFITAIASRKPIKLIKKLDKKTIVFKDAREFLTFSDYDILIELIGGEDGISKTIIVDALKKRKNIVTANKALIAKHGIEILKISEKYNCKIRFEAAVAGVIPIVKVLKEFLICNKISKVFGILNGTANFILSKMQEEKRNFKSSLEDAQRLGYAESDSSFDINGKDTAHKLSILSMISFGNIMNSKIMFVEGIENIQIEDIKFADVLGYKIKLLGITQKIKNKVSQFVYPCLISKKSAIANVSNANNAIEINSDFSEKIFLQGKGAGSSPTATSVLSDIIDLSSKINNNSLEIKSKNLKKIKPFDIKERLGSYYLRLITQDKPGVIADISKEFKNFNISMKSMLQKETKLKNKDFAEIVLTTHDCIEKDMQSAIKKINSMEFIKNNIIMYRIENI